ncbi:MAG TPA: hypothetical protein VNI82_00040 [Candidatus Nitrosotenuis sp.]|nr:hypothetical protein [Candidatus Nitrosotenuis sp.]
MKHFKLFVATVLSGFFIAVPLTVASSSVVEAQTAKQKLCEGAGSVYNSATGNCNSGGGGRTLPQYFKVVVDILLFVIGAVSVVMIVIGGLKYTLSNGDQSAVTSAKNTILYAVIGLVVAVLAYAIVQFVVGGLI